MKVLPLFFVLALLAGPDSDPKPKPPASPAPPAKGIADRGPVVARVNGSAIYKSDYDRALAEFLRASGIGSDAPAEKRKENEKIVLDGLIGDELLYQKATSIPVEVSQDDVDRSVQRARSTMGEEVFQRELKERHMTLADLQQSTRRNLMVQKMLREKVANTVVVSEQEIRKFYDEHPKELAVPESVEASHILVRSEAADAAEKRAQARKKIDSALTRVRGGEDFASVAKELSEDTSADQGGVLGTIRRGETVPPFEQAAFALGVGQVSEVVESQYGYHVIKVTAKQAADLMKFEEVRDRIAAFLKREKSQEEIEKFVGTLREQAKIDIPG